MGMVEAVVVVAFAAGRLPCYLALAGCDLALAVAAQLQGCLALGLEEGVAAVAHLVGSAPTDLALAVLAAQLECALAAVAHWLGFVATDLALGLENAFAAVANCFGFVATLAVLVVAVAHAQSLQPPFPEVVLDVAMMVVVAVLLVIGFGVDGAVHPLQLC